MVSSLVGVTCAGLMRRGRPDGLGEAVWCVGGKVSLRNFSGVGSALLLL